MNNLCFAVRQLFKNPGFTCVAVLTLALGIGANTSMFSVLNRLLMQALPYPRSDRLVRVFRTSPQSKTWPHSPANFLDYREQNNVFERFAAFAWWNFNLSETGKPSERLRAVLGSSDFFPVLGIQPLFGRVFSSAETEPGRQNVAVISHGFWMRRFAGDRNILGHTLRLDGEVVTIIGVMPPLMEQPRDAGWGTVDAWLPLAFSAAQRVNRGDNWLQEMARLKPGVSLGQAQASIDALARHLEQAYPQNNSQMGMRLLPLGDSITDDGSRRLLWMSFGLTLFVLLIACANIANLQLTRAAGRVREFALRSALGARRVQLVYQLLTESIVLSCLGGFLGLMFAFWSNKFLETRMASTTGNSTFHLPLDWRVLLFAFGCSSLTGILFGLMPTWLASRVDMNAALKESTRGTAGRAQHRLRDALIIGEIALALMLLTGAALFIRGLDRFTHLDPGWKVDGLFMGQIVLTGPKYNSEELMKSFYLRLEDRVASLPGVQSVAVSRSIPIYAFGSSRGIAVDGVPNSQPGREPVAFFESVSPGYFNTLKIQLVEGHGFTVSDDATHPGVIVINKKMAHALWPNESPIGKRIGNGNPEKREWKTVVGVANDLHFPANMNAPETAFQVYCPMAQEPRPYLAIHVRTSSSPAALSDSLQKTLAELDPELSIYEIEGARHVVNRVLANAGLLGQILLAFALLGLVLAAVGIYGVVSYSVLQRFSEMGIRMALGAGRSHILQLMLRQGMQLSLLGTVIGIVGSYGVFQLLSSITPEIPTRDPLAGVVMILLLMAVVLLASWIPARRASKLDPILALRYE